MKTKINKDLNELLNNFNYSLDKEGITNSLLVSYMTCERKFLFAINKLRLKKPKINTVFGSIIHDVLASVYAKNKLPKEKDLRILVEKTTQSIIEKENILEDISLLRTKILVLTPLYFEFYKNDFKMKFIETEKEFCVPFHSYKLRGKKDARFLIKKRKWILETKSKSRITEDKLIDTLALNSQNLFYMVTDEIETGSRACGVLYNIIRNPAINPRQEESLKDYAERLKKDVQKRLDFYFIRMEIPYTGRDLKAYKKDLKAYLDEINYKITIKYPLTIFKRNFNSCNGEFVCDFCKNCANENLLGLEKKEKLFSELDIGV